MIRISNTLSVNPDTVCCITDKEDYCSSPVIYFISGKSVKVVNLTFDSLCDKLGI